MKTVVFKLRVLLFNTTDSQGTDWWLGAGVYAKDSRYQITPVDLHPNRGWNWLEHVCADYDCAIIVRPLAPAHMQIIDELKFMGIPVFAAWDDALWNLPDGHPAQYQYTQAATNHLRGIYDMLDGAIFSTVGVHEHFKRHVRIPEKVAVLQNCLHDLFRIAPEYRGEANRDLPLLVRGSHCHQPDWNAAKAKWFDPRPHDYLFLGINPFNMRTIPAMPCLQYNRFLPSAPSRAFFFPLVVNEFNIAKSNICAIEANVAGQVCIVPELDKFPEFAHSGWALDAKSLDDLHDNGTWREHWQKTRNSIVEHAVMQRDLRAKTLADWCGKTIFG